MTGTEVVILAVLLGLIPAAVASRKGESFLGFWLFGALLFIVALPVALMLKPQPGRGERWCAQCRAIVPVEARVCSHCRADLTAPVDVPVPVAAGVSPAVVRAGWFAIALGIVSLGYMAWVMMAAG